MLKVMKSGFRSRTRNCAVCPGSRNCVRCSLFQRDASRTEIKGEVNSTGNVSLPFSG
jgi:hypothetical protein